MQETEGKRKSSEETKSKGKALEAAEPEFSMEINPGTVTEKS